MQSDNGHIRYLRKLDENVKKALYLGGQLVGNKAQEFSPEDTGTMMRSVDVTPARRVQGVLTVYIGTGPEAPYAPYTEEDRYIENKELGPKSQQKSGAQMPWLRPALEAEKDDVLKILSSAIIGTR